VEREREEERLYVEREKAGTQGVPKMENAQRKGKKEMGQRSLLIEKRANANFGI